MSTEREYGPRDTLSVLMRHGHKIAYRWTLRGSQYWTVDGRGMRLRELEDLAAQYEPGCFRWTAPG